MLSSLLINIWAPKLESHAILASETSFFQNSSSLISNTALYSVAVATVASFLGQSVARKLINLLGRASLIIFILSFTIFVSAICDNTVFHWLIIEMDFLGGHFFFPFHFNNNGLFSSPNGWSWDSKCGWKDWTSTWDFL